MDVQEQSPFFGLPVETRRKIYSHAIGNTDAIHVFLRQGRLAFCECIENGPAHSQGGYERRARRHSAYGFAIDLVSDTRWIQRLRSSWGPHWECEEVSRKMDQIGADEVLDVMLPGTVMPVTSVCIRMQLDFLISIANAADFIITDLETLERLVHENPTPEAVPPAHDILRIIAPSLRTLDIALWLPLAFFKALEDEVDPDGSGRLDNAQALDEALTKTEASDKDVTHLLTRWMHVWPSLGPQLEQLHNVNIWLDHNQPLSWSLVNERAVISHLATSILSGAPPILKGITIEVPKLHPRYERPERHFMANSLPPPALVTIKRRLRQRCFAKETSPGQFSMEHKNDFPYLIEVPEFQDQPLEEIERMERELWESGEDPEEFIMHA
ncbi:hypothetical protein GQ53DRAFT_744054 [Thozetella sp. PMI_491]|nr:hypothetical protein GQ53DRAFT_744054 [Thozetella sp. PMI_491]